MTSQTILMSPSNSMETLEASLCAPSEERMIQSVRLHYQTNHQEEFLRLKAQVESLLIELNDLSENRSDAVTEGL